jgi:hypothetical protein
VNLVVDTGVDSPDADRSLAWILRAAATVLDVILRSGAKVSVAIHGSLYRQQTVGDFRHRVLDALAMVSPESNPLPVASLAKRLNSDELLIVVTANGSSALLKFETSTQSICRIVLDTTSNQWNAVELEQRAMACPAWKIEYRTAHRRRVRCVNEHARRRA